MEPSESSSKTEHAAVPQHSSLQQEVRGEGNNLRETVEEALVTGDDESREETPLFSWTPQHRGGDGGEMGGGGGRVCALQQREGGEDVETVFDKVSMLPL